MSADLIVTDWLTAAVQLMTWKSHKVLSDGWVFINSIAAKHTHTHLSSANDNCFIQKISSSMYLSHNLTVTISQGDTLQYSKSWWLVQWGEIKYVTNNLNFSNASSSFCWQHCRRVSWVAMVRARPKMALLWRKNNRLKNLMQIVYVISCFRDDLL